MAEYDNKAIIGFPDPLANPEVKISYKYGLAYAKAMWSAYTRNQLWWNGRKQRDIINRKYAEGLESIEKYKDRLDMQGDTSWLNLDFNPVTRIANLVDNVVGRLMAQDYKIQCNPIDPASRAKIDDARDAMRANMLLKPINDVVEPQTGISLIPKDKPIPESDEEADLFFQLNHKAGESIAMEEGLAAVFYNTEFEDTKRKVIRDAVVLKKLSIHVKYDENYNIIPEYADPVDLVYPYSKYEDFRNVPYVGKITKYTIGQLAQMTNEFDEPTLWKIANEQAGKNNNPNWQWGNTYEGYYWDNQVYAGRPYDDFNVSVMEFYFLCADTQKYVKKDTSGDRFYFDKKNPNYKIDKSSNTEASKKKEMLERAVQYLYEGKWVIGTEYMYGYKKCSNIPRERKLGAYSPKAELPIIMIYPDIYDMQNKSLVERLIPHEDQINLIHQKQQQFLIKAKPPGVKIDLEGMENITVAMGSGSMTSIDITKMYEQTGNYIFRSKDKAGNIINSSVIEPLDNGIGRGFMELFEAYNQELQKMNDVIGFNSATDGSTPDPKSLVGVQKLSLNATNSALRPLNFAYIRLIERVSKRLTLMIQDSIEFENQAFINSIGNQATSLIKLGKDIAMNEFGIKVELLPDEEERAQINQDISIALANKEITMADAIMVRQVLRQNTKLAEQLLVLREKKNIENAKAEAANNAKINGEEQTKAAQAAAEANTQSALAIEEAKRKTMQFEYELKSKLSAQEHLQKMPEIELANQGKIEIAHKNAEGGIVKAGIAAHASMSKASDNKEAA